MNILRNYRILRVWTVALPITVNRTVLYMAAIVVHEQSGDQRTAFECDIRARCRGKTWESINEGSFECSTAFGGDWNSGNRMRIKHANIPRSVPGDICFSWKPAR